VHFHLLFYVLVGTASGWFWIIFSDHPEVPSLTLVYFRSTFEFKKWGANPYIYPAK